MTDDAEIVRRKAARKVWVYTILVLALTTVLTVYLDHAPLPGRLKSTAVMWGPAFCAFAVKLSFDRNLSGLGLAKSGGGWLLVGFLLPLAYALPVYLPVWFSGMGGFDPDRWRTAVPYLGTSGSAGEALALLLTVGLLDKLSRALGEEIGWRGFLVPELLKLMPFWKAGLVSGVIWFAFHLPGIFIAGYSSGGGVPLSYQIACFAVMVISAAVVFAWVRVRSGSVWPCAMMHASHNLVIQSILDRATMKGPLTAYVIGEFGCGLAITSVLTALIVLSLYRRARVA